MIEAPIGIPGESSNIYKKMLGNEISSCPELIYIF